MLMDETQIAAKVATNIPREIHVPAPDVPEVSVDGEIDYGHLNYEDPVLIQRFSDYFELPRMAKYTEESQRHIRTVLEWANQMTGSTDVADLLLYIQRAERELGINFKPNRLARVYRFVRIQEQALGLDKEMELLRG